MENKDHRIAYLEQELGRAYRAIQGFASAEAKGEPRSDGQRGYHAPTVAAAKRFVFEEALDGTAYFDGKPVEVLHKALSL